MQNCLGELNLTYCWIYFDDMIVFLKMEEEHLQCLHIVFDHFREHNMRLKATKCTFHWNKINYLVHHVSKEGVWPSKEILKAVAEFALPWTYMDIWGLCGLVGHYQQFIKGFAYIAQLLHEHLSGKGTSKMNEWVPLTEDALGAVLAFADLNKPFLLETDASTLGLEAVLLQKQADCQYHPLAYAS